MSTETIVLILSSAGTATLITCIFEVIKSLVKRHQEVKDRELKKQEIFLKNKEAAYLSALDRLIQIRKGLDYTRENIALSKELQENFRRQEEAFEHEASKIRLYSSDKIFDLYHMLSNYASYAYAPQNGPRLIENSKWVFDAQIIMLARYMQEDLGIRKFSTDNNQKIKCPRCGFEHDIFGKCPDCGMDRNELEKMIEDMNKKISRTENIEK